MADVSKITVNNITYNIKDSVARDHIANRLNPHNVTKAQVGLGNVADIDQRKAIKNITRSGTTFTATALDGTTFTFTQQDTNTTYDAATQSVNGLLSANDKKAIDREFFRMIPNGGTYINGGSDINSIEYLKVGNYYNSLSEDASTIKNIPVQSAFMMFVLSPLSAQYDNESTSTWVYRLRIFVSYDGRNIYTQLVSSGTEVGVFWYGDWFKITISSDLFPINSHINNKSNPHSVSKSQIGLGNVANYDQSKAIKSITRSGTTFTYTTLDGTTGTFTQQDTNTTYPVATSSSDGLMSKADKAKLDGIGAGSNVKSVNGKTGAVTLAKGDVGLANVANYDQSKAIKSITRSGTTFTATALDGTTTTFTQQDSNTTYPLASSSSNGLMSSSDKKKLDSMKAASVSGTTLIL